MRFTCFHCDRPFEVTSEHLGAEVLCPHCKRRVRLPSAGTATAREEEEGGGLGLWLRSSVSGLVSFVVHVAVLFTLSLVTCDYRGGGGLGEEVLIGELAAEQLSEVPKDQLDGADTATLSKEQQDKDETFEEVSPPDPTADGEAVEVQVVSLAPSGAGGGAPEIGTVAGGGGALGDGASFMGVHARGKRFCIIADRSGSMAGEKVEYVKQEVLEALSTMRAGARFQLIFFNHGALPYPKSGWRHPQKDRPDVEQWIKDIPGAGGTYPTPAFEIAFRLNPLPDVIFFMTDGLFPPPVVDEVAAMNRRSDKKVVIHTISFVERSAEGLLRQIAKDSGGKYRHVAGF